MKKTLLMGAALFAITAFSIQPTQGQTVGLVQQDSTQLLVASPSQYDFYYSAKQAVDFEQISTASYTLDDRIKRNRFRDKTFTQRVVKGLPIPSGYDDYVWIGLGTTEEIKPNGEW